MVLDDPSGYGRVVRAPDGTVERVVETKAPATRPSSSCRSARSTPGCSRSTARRCSAALERGPRRQRPGRAYLPDVLPIMRAHERTRAAPTRSSDPRRAARDQRPRPAGRGHGRSRSAGSTSATCSPGVTIVDPAATVIDVEVEIGQDTVIAPFTSLHGSTEIGAGVDDRARSHADRRRGRRRGQGRCTPTSTARTIGDRRERRAVRLPAARAPSCARAPRPARSWRSRTPTSARAPRCPHLSYIGDADIGEGTNLGAATITANYDGYRKHRTTIGARRQDERRHDAGGARERRRRRLHGRRVGHHRGRARRARSGSRARASRTSRATPSARRPSARQDGDDRRADGRRAVTTTRRERE